MKKVAFITGGGGFLGSETAITLARAGYTVAVGDINAETVNKTVERILAEGGEAKGYVFDVSESREVDAAVDDTVNTFGRLDAMIHVAGGSARIAGPNTYSLLSDQQDYVIDRVLKVNLYGAFWASRAAARVMIKQGEGGRIINFASTVGVNGLPGCTEYAASKGGIMSLTKALAKELGEHKITVNAVAPGIVCRDEVDTTTPDGHHYAYETNFLGEMCKAPDIANMVEFLCSDKARFITGQTYIVDGGRSLGMKGSD